MLPTMAIVTTTYRYKRPPKRKKAVPLKVGRIARAGQVASTEPTAETSEPPAAKVSKPVIVTAKRKPGRFGEVEDMTPQEHQLRGDATNALWRELVRRATEGGE